MPDTTVSWNVPDWLLETVQRQDRDRYLCCMFLPKDHRYHALSVLAFHAEIARIREIVTEPAMGYIRIQWWRDALNQPIQNHSEAPILTALRNSPNSVSLAPVLHEILDVRQDDIERKPFASVAEAESWVEKTTKPLMKALAYSIGLSDQTAIDAFDQAAMAHGLMGVLRSSKAFAVIGRPIWMQNLDDTAIRQELGKEVTVRAELALAEVSSRCKDVPDSAFAFALPAVLAKQHICDLKSSNYEIFASRFVGPSRVTLRMLWTHLRKKI